MDALVLLWCLAGLAGLVAALWQLVIERNPSLPAGEENLRRLWPFWLASAVTWGGLTALWWRLRRNPDVGLTRVAGGVRQSCLAILFVAVVVRGAVLLAHEPALSDDVYRYVFDGRNLASGENPYLVQPLSRQGEPERWPGEAALVPLINNPELHTIYLPTSQWVFAATALMAPPSMSSPSSLARLFRLVLVVFELAAIGMVLTAVVGAGRSPWWAALYAWHPLAITEIAGTGHQESIGLAFLLLALLLHRRWPRPIAPWTLALADGRPREAGGPSGGSAPAPRTALDGVAAQRGGRRRSVPWPLRRRSGSPIRGQALFNLRATSARFSLKWAHFGSVYEPLLALVERLTPTWGNDPQEQLTRVICAALLGVCILAIWRRGGQIWDGARAIFFAMVLCSPSAHPWYLLWALVLVPMAISPAVWIASLTLPLGYVAFRYSVDAEGTVGWSVPAKGVFLIAYVPVYAALLWSGWRHLASRRR